MELSLNKLKLQHKVIVFELNAKYNEQNIKFYLEVMCYTEGGVKLYQVHYLKKNDASITLKSAEMRKIKSEIMDQLEADDFKIIKEAI